MFCGQCGKRVLDTMLFCPFCGSPIVIPDQEVGEPDAAAPAPAEAIEQPAAGLPEIEEAVFPEVEEEPEAEEPFAPEPETEEDFEPLHFDAPEDFDALAGEPEILPEAEEPERTVSLFDDAEEAEIVSLEPETQEIPLEEAPRRASPVGRRPEGPSARRSNQTFIPVRNVDMDDIFMDNAHPDTEDAYDPYDDDDGYDGGFDFEEPERGGFLQRHIRGVVGLILLLILIVVCLIWAIMPKGQQMLATANLAWSAETYNDLGYDAYKAEQYHQAATYFERALARDTDNYEYAHSAMVAYYEAGETDSALSMLKKCIEMRPDDPEPYHEMLILYPNGEERPWEVKELLRLGYERTGDESLNITGE